MRARTSTCAWQGRCGDSKAWRSRTARTVFTHESLVGWTRSAGLRPIVVKAGYLPLTMKSRLPQSYWLTRTYLALGSPVLGGQMLVVAERP